MFLDLFTERPTFDSFPLSPLSGSRTLVRTFPETVRLWSVICGLQATGTLVCWNVGTLEPLAFGRQASRQHNPSVIKFVSLVDQSTVKRSIKRND